jgi:steroid delta-isomerase-like uncharacterized protein
MRTSATIIGVLAACVAVPAAAQPSGQCANIGTPAKNIALAKGFYQAFASHAKDQLDSVLAADWIDVPMAPGQKPGLAGMKAAMDGYYATFPDFTPTNDDFIASGDKVVVRSTITATQRGAFAGVAATGKSISVMAIDIHRICNGRIAETWHVEDWLSGLFQMGGLPRR